MVIIAQVWYVISYTNNMENLALYCLYYIYEEPGKKEPSL